MYPELWDVRWRLEQLRREAGDAASEGAMSPLDAVSKPAVVGPVSRVRWLLAGLLPGPNSSHARSGRVWDEERRYRTVRLGILIATCSILATSPLAAASASATPVLAAGTSATARTLVVDNGVRQCPESEYTTISSAVIDANVGDVIRVCPGIYAEQVTIDKPLTIRGDAETIEAIDCFGATPLATDPMTQAIVTVPTDVPDGVEAILFDVQADNVELQGLLLQGWASSPWQLNPSGAIRTSRANSGYRIHHNLIVGHTVATYLRSDGVYSSSFDHNCLRENGWGVANNWQPLTDARIHHNMTYRTGNFSFEQTANCAEPPDPCAGIGMVGVMFDHNVSASDGIPYRIGSSVDTILFNNTVTNARIGVRLLGGNENLQIVDNWLSVGQVGLARQSNPPIASNFGALIRGNTIVGKPGTGAGIGMGAGGLRDSSILENVITGFDGEGLVLLASNTGNLVRGNTVDGNGSNGIRVAAGATGNVFELNQMHGNGRLVATAVDARDDARAFNVWSGNECETDIPLGTICGIE